MIICENVCKIYGNLSSENFVKALDNINLKIDDGEFVSIIGKSGSGKTTLLNVLGTVSKPTSGCVLINDVNMSEKKSKELSEFRNKQIGFIFQSFYLENSLNALENVALPMMINRKERKEYTERAEYMLKLVGLENRIKHRPSELSGGERQRVCIARAFVNNPQIILADEPTGNLDEKTGKEVMDNILKLSENKTLILVTHDMDMARLAPRTIKLADGKII